MVKFILEGFLFFWKAFPILSVYWKIELFYTVNETKLFIQILSHLTSGRRACRRARPPDWGWAHSQRCPLCRWLTRLPVWTVDPGCVWSHSKTRSTRPARDQDGGAGFWGENQGIETQDAIKMGNSWVKPTDGLWCLVIDEAQIPPREKKIQTQSCISCSVAAASRIGHLCLVLSGV